MKIVTACASTVPQLWECHFYIALSCYFYRKVFTSNGYSEVRHRTSLEQAEINNFITNP